MDHESATDPAVSMLQNAHRVTVEDVEDEDDIGAPAPKPATIDTQSEEVFPTLGGSSTVRQTVVAPVAWNKSHLNEHSKANGSFGQPQTTQNGSAPASGASTPIPGVKKPAVNIPGRSQRIITLTPNDLMPRQQWKKPLPDLVKDSNKRGRVKITHSTAGPNHQFLAEGPEKDIGNALRDLIAQIGARSDTKISVPASTRGNLIGRDGANIKAMEALSGCRINIPRENPESDGMVDVIVNGTKVGQMLAQEAINQKMGSQPTSASTKVAPIPSEFYHFIDGRGGANRAAWEQAHNVQINIPEFVHLYPASRIPSSEQEDGRPSFSPCHDTCIHVTGHRDSVTAARRAIEQKAEELRQKLMIRNTRLPRGDCPFIIGDRGIPMSQFFAETGCVLIMPEDEDDELVRIVGLSPDDLKAAEDKCSELLDEMVSMSLGVNTFGKSARHSYNVARYLREVAELARIEQMFDVYINAPKTESGADQWTFYVRAPKSDGGKARRRGRDARDDIHNIASAFPQPRMRNLQVDDFYHKYLKEFMSEVVHEKYGVRTIVPDKDEKGADILLVYEGSSPADSSLFVPRQAATTAQFKEFRAGLEGAESFILDFLKKQDPLVTQQRNVPNKFHAKLKKFIKEENSGNNRPADQIPVRVKQAGTNISFQGPSSAVESLLAKVDEWLKQAEADDKERGFTMSFDFPERFANRLIGKGGQMIASLRDKFDVDINVHDGIVELKGPKAKCEAAKSHIGSMGRQFEDETTHVLKIEPKFHRALIGTGGEKINRLQTRYKVRINFPPTQSRDSKTSDTSDAESVKSARPRRQQAADEVIVKGPKRGADEARDELLSLALYIRDTSYEEVVTVNKKHLPQLIGTRGATMDEIRTSTKAIINVPSAPRDKESDEYKEWEEKEFVDIEIKGTKEQVKAAKKALEEKKAIYDDTITVELEVDKAYHRALIGQGGSNIRSIIVKAGGPDSNKDQARVVRFPQANDERPNVVTIEGRNAVVTNVVAAITEFVKERESQVTESIDVPTDKHRTIIGRGGDTKKQLETEFKVSINVPRQGEGKTEVTITGQPDGVEQAKARIESMVKEQDGETIQVPRSLHYMVSGGGQLFRRLKNENQVTIGHDGQKPPTKPSPPTTTTGSMPLITDEAQLDGYRWGVVPMADDGDIAWVLRGSTENIAKAKSIIEAAIEKHKGKDQIGFLTLADPGMYRYVVGPRGSKIEPIRKSTGADIQVPQGNSSKPIEIIGSKDGIEKAKEQILANLAESRKSAGKSQAPE